VKIPDVRNVKCIRWRKRSIEALIRRALHEEAEAFAVRNAETIRRITERCLAIVGV